MTCDMARKVECGKFLVIEATRNEMNIACGSPGICDYCGTPSENGYYIAVLNKWYCPKCYEDFKKRAVWRHHDYVIEERNFKCYGQLLGVVLPDYMAEAGCEIIEPPLGLNCAMSVKYKGRYYHFSLRMLKRPDYLRAQWELIKGMYDDNPPQER